MTMASPSSSMCTDSTPSSQSKKLRSSGARKIEDYLRVSLIPQPIIHFNLPNLLTTRFVNVVFETSDASQSSPFFRVSNEDNKEIFRVVELSRPEGNSCRRGVKYLRCQDGAGSCILNVAYPVGLGEVALLSPNEELVGECQSKVEFVCLSVKLKYNFYDANGNRLLKMTGILPEEGNRRKFMLIVKRSKTEKLALITMGSLKTCCHIKFKHNQPNELDRLQIITLWIGFMHNEIKDMETPMLIEKHAAIQKRRKESRVSVTQSLQNSFSGTSAVVANSSRTPDRSITSENSHQEESSESKPHSSINIAKVKDWKNVVASHFAGRKSVNINNNISIMQNSDKNNRPNLQPKDASDINDDNQELKTYA